MNETLLIVILVVAMLAVTTVLSFLAVRAARWLSQGTFLPVAVCGVVVILAMIVVVVLFGVAGTTIIESYTEPAPMTGDSRATPLPRSPGLEEGETCWSAEAAVDSRSVVNLRQWRYVQLVEWCGDGSQIVEILKNERSWDSLSPFWDFERYHDVSETQWDDRYFVFSQAKFRFCAVLESFCILEDNPSLDMTAYANGTFNAEYHWDWIAGEDSTQVLRTSVWGATTAALAGFLGAAPLALLLIAVGYVATRSKTEGLRSLGVGLMAGGIILAGVLPVTALLIA